MKSAQGQWEEFLTLALWLILLALAGRWIFLGNDLTVFHYLLEVLESMTLV